MSFIAINAKADIISDGTSPSTTTKKGKVNPAQNAMINAWTLSKKTGIFNIKNKINDDFIRCEYNQIGSPVDNKVTITFNKGYFVVCGRLVEVEQGSTVDIYLTSTGQSNGTVISAGRSVDGKIVARFDLSKSQEKEFEVLATTDDIVTEDLNINTTGRYDFVLYEYTAYYNRVELHPRDESIYIDDVAGNLENFEKNLYSTVKPLNGYDDSKGTIEERLISLGFKSPVFTNVNTTYVGTGYGGFTEGNITSLYIPTKSSLTPIRNVSLATISNIHLPKEDLTINFNSGGGDATVYSVKFTTEGRLELSYTSYGFGSENGPSFDGEIVIRIYNGEQSVDNKLNWYTTMK